MNRITWDEMFLQIAQIVAQRSTCLRRKVGAVLAQDNHLIATGYNGAASGLEHCLDVGCIREQMNIPSGERHELCRAVHSEQNVIIQAALHGRSTKGAVMYVTLQPCAICAKMIVNAGISMVVFPEGEFYPDSLALKTLTDGGVMVELY